MRRIAPAFAVAAALAILAAPAEAARPSAEDAPPPSATPEVASELVLRIQRALSRLGLYAGREHGRLDAGTRAAIRLYQQSQGLEPDGRATPALAEALIYAVDVRRLLRRLDVSRAASQSAARAKLLAHPATRDLVAPGRTAEVADPTRDPTPCFEQPTVRCLVTEARETAKAVFKPELRDWVLGDILTAEARAGLSERAMDTAARIKDPRMIVVALRDIAEAKAAGGDAGAALQAAEIIPDRQQRAEALIAIAAIQVRRGDLAAVGATFARLGDAVAQLDDPVRRIAFRAREAALRFEAGERDLARALLRAAKADAAALDGPGRRNALRHVATAHAGTVRSGGGLAALDGLGPVGSEMSVRMAAVRALAAAGQLAPAAAVAAQIAEPRFRALALARLAQAHADGGDLAACRDSLAAAAAEVSRIDKPFARDYARGRLVAAHLALAAAAAARRDAAFAAAVELASAIADARMKAQTLWRIAEARRRLSDAAGAAATERQARTATAAIVGDVSRVWMFADLAIGEAARNPAAARTFFERGLETAAGINNAWARARALAKLSTTLLTLVDPGRGRAADDETPVP